MKITVGMPLERFIKKNKLTQCQAAELLGITQGTVSQAVNGKGAGQWYITDEGHQLTIQKVKEWQIQL